MFDKLKQINELRKLQGEFKKEKMTLEKRGIVIVMNGNFEIEDVKLNAQLSLEDQQRAVKEVINEARESIQKKLAQKMMGSGIGF
ncbi:MAG: hypothetical protein FJZ43_01195 [Candidatus Staskawiczbacteria bacterium]|nr:hypothetical protein [Candidatus Staskawiczbacteria bacterium]